MSVIKTRGHQLFPVLDATQIDTAKHFASGPERKFAPGEIVYNAGERDVPTWLVLKGSLAAVRRDGLNHETAITNLGPGQFSGEVNQLAGAATLASVRTRGLYCPSLRCDARACTNDRLRRDRRDHDASIHPSPRRVALVRYWSAGPAHRNSYGFRAFSVAMGIPAPCSIPPPMPKPVPC
jgi:hypothetical protein